MTQGRKWLSTRHPDRHETIIDRSCMSAHGKWSRRSAVTTEEQASRTKHRCPYECRTKLNPTNQRKTSRNGSQTLDNTNHPTHQHRKTTSKQHHNLRTPTPSHQNHPNKQNKKRPHNPQNHRHAHEQKQKETQTYTPVVEYFASSPAVIQASPVVEYIASAPAVIQASPVVEYISPVPAVISSPEPVVEHLHPRQQWYRQRQWWSILHPRQQ